jgi:hypothetical protein
MKETANWSRPIPRRHEIPDFYFRLMGEKFLSMTLGDERVARPGHTSEVSYYGRRSITPISFSLQQRIHAIKGDLNYHFLWGE